MGHPGSVRLWIADGLSNLGIFTFSLAVQFLMIDVIGANQVEIGLVRSAQWLPFLLFGLISGVVADRVRRKHLLVGTDVMDAQRREGPPQRRWVRRVPRQQVHLQDAARSPARPTTRPLVSRS